MIRNGKEKASEAKRKVYIFKNVSKISSDPGTPTLQVTWNQKKRPHAHLNM